MNRQQLEHVIRAAAQVTNQYDIVVVGSQSILGAFPNAPPACTMSMEADVFALYAEELSDAIDGAIGEFSRFHEMNGYYAQGVDSHTSVLPQGWRERLVRVQNENTAGFIGWCLDPTDLFLAKCAAWREKDREFNRALLAANYVDPNVALLRVSDMPGGAEAHLRLTQRIRRLLTSPT